MSTDAPVAASNGIPEVATPEAKQEPTEEQEMPFSWL